MEALFVTLSIMSGVVGLACLAGTYEAGCEAIETLDAVAVGATLVLFVLFGLFMWAAFSLYPEPR